MPPFHSGTAIDRPETTKTIKLPPIPEVDWQQTLETSFDQHKLCNIVSDSTKETFKKLGLTDTQLSDVARQMLPPKGNQSQNPVLATEQSPENQTGNEPVPFLSCSKGCPTDIQESEKST